MRSRSMIWITCLLLGLLGMIPSARSADVPYHRVVLILWDTSQSMVMRKAGPTADVKDLQRLQKYVSDLLFHGLSLPVSEPDYQRCEKSFLQNPQPLINPKTLLIAHRFHVVLETPEGKVIPPSTANREEELWKYLPKPSISKEAGYVNLETELVRPVVDAITKTEEQGFIHPQLEELFLVIVSDNLTETTIPPANLPQKYLDFYYSRLESELLNHRICTIGVHCNSQADSIHRILVNVYQISKQAYLSPGTQAEEIPSPTPTANLTPTPTRTPATPPTPWTLALHLPPAGLGLTVQGNRVVSEQFEITAASDTTLQVPLPSFWAELLDDQGNVVSQGSPVFDGGQHLPVKTYINFDPIQGDQWPTKARWIVSGSSEIAGITPTETPTHKNESLWPFAWVLILFVLVVGGFLFLFRFTREKDDHSEMEENLDDGGRITGKFKQAKVTLTLEPSWGGGNSMEFFLSTGESYQFGQPIQGHPWFENVDCLSYSLRLEKKWLQSAKLILEEPLMLGELGSDSPDPRRKIEIPVAFEPESRIIQLKGNSKAETWELQITIQWISQTQESRKKERVS